MNPDPRFHSATIVTPCRNTARIVELVDNVCRAFMAAEDGDEGSQVSWDIDPLHQAARGTFSCHGAQKVRVSRLDKDMIARVAPQGPFERVLVMVDESSVSLILAQLAGFALSGLGEVKVALDPATRLSTALAEPKPTVFDLVNMRFLEPEAIRNFVDDHAAGLFLSEQPFSAVFGADETLVRQALELPPEGRRERALREIGQMRPPMHIRFLESWRSSVSEVAKFTPPLARPAGVGLLRGD